MTVDENLLIVACEAETVHGPYAECAGGPANMGALVGLALKAGFVKAANERLRGVLGCTHIREMLQQMATVAHQSMWPVRERRRARELAEAQRLLTEARAEVERRPAPVVPGEQAVDVRVDGVPTEALPWRLRAPRP